MKILPPVTAPPDEPQVRRHSPRPSRRWRDYRACLRWDFAFTCAFCLLHEVDYFGAVGGEGLGGTSVEHLDPRSETPARAGDYGNVVYACRLCNRSRSSRPTTLRGRRLLDPTRDAWISHFAPRGDLLEPRARDADAHYTCEAYDLNHPRKVERRRQRRELLTDRVRLTTDLGEEIEHLLAAADELLAAGDLPHFREALDEAQTLRDQALRARADMARYPAVPRDAPTRCRCGSAENHVLPAWLADQSLEEADS